MRDEEFVKKYEELLDKGYCNCNEMNCIDNNSPRRILNIAKRLQLEEDDLLKENQELKKENESLRQLQCTFLGTGCKRKIEEYESQQKWFIEYLEKEIKETETTIEMLCDTNSCRIPYLQNKNRLLKEILLNYKEIIGSETNER